MEVGAEPCRQQRACQSLVAAQVRDLGESECGRDVEVVWGVKEVMGHPASQRQRKPACLPDVLPSTNVLEPPLLLDTLDRQACSPGGVEELRNVVEGQQMSSQGRELDAGWRLGRLPIVERSQPVPPVGGQGEQ